MKNQARILGVGIATMDIYCHHNKMYPGGNEFNIAWHAKEFGAESAFMGVFADDRVGAILEETLKRQGVEISRSRHEKGSSGYCLVDIVEGDRVFLDWNKEGVTDRYPFSFTEAELEYMKQFDVAAMSLFGRVDDVNIIKASAAGVKICYDFGDTFDMERIRQICPYVRYAFFSCSDLDQQEVRNVLAQAVQCGTDLAVATRGSKSALAFDGNQYHEQMVEAVKDIRDTMGAGDSFIGAFLTNYLSEIPADEQYTADDKIQASLREAAKYSATIVSKDGSLGIGYDVDVKQLNQIINL